MKHFLFILLAMFVPLSMTAQVDDLFDDDNDDETLVTDSVGRDTVSAEQNAMPWPQRIQSRLDGLIQGNSMLTTSQLGLMVYDLTADSTLYRYNERQMMRPASTLKAITAITAIDRLGGSYQLKTTLYYKGTIENRTLRGDIYCTGGFDPRFNSDDMNAFVEGIRRMGVDTIRGRIVADKSMKDDDRLGEGWCWDDDNPVLSPLLISRKDRFVERFVDELREVGVVVDAEQTEGRTPQDAFAICTRSHTMDQILMKMMKESDNLYAEALFYQIAASTGARPAKARNARNIVLTLAAKAGANTRMCRIADGSGLSLYNYVSAEFETRILRYAYNNSNIYLHLYPALPIAGEDGTLRKRMKNSFTAGNVHAKTGTVMGVSSLTGYCTASNGHVLCFSILNQGVLHSSNGRNFQDRVCNILCQP